MKKKLIYHTLTTLIISTFCLSASAQQTQYSELIITEMEFGTAIEWTTYNEKNTKAFVIEKSTDAVNFEEVVTLDPIRNNKHKKGYSYVDLGLGTKGEKVHYRIKGVHNDGIFSQGKMAAVTKKHQNHFAVSNFEMNESSNEYTLYYTSMVEGDMQMDVVAREDASILQTEFYQASIGFNKLELDLKTIASGNYELVFTLDNETASVVLIKSGEALPENLMSQKPSEKSNN